MAISLLNQNARDITNELIMPNGKLKLLSAMEYEQFTQEEIKLFCYKTGRYGLPTVELVKFLKDIINGRSAIEIGAGCGDLGYHLDIPMTDSKIQNDPVINLMYKELNQPTIKYPDDVVKLEAIQAIYKYKPKVVIGSWVTRYQPKTEPDSGSGFLFGIKEDKVIRLCETYIVIGNLDIHKEKPIRKLPHATLNYPWLMSRASYPENNRIFVWDKNIKKNHENNDQNEDFICSYCGKHLIGYFLYCSPECNDKGEA